MTEKRKRKDKNISIEELYRNKNFVPPKEKNLETIFEEPRKSKDGVPMLTSVKKFKRYLHFDTTVGKIHKRKVKAKKCIKKMKMGNLKTRSATKLEECQDISLYISEVLGESSDSEMDITNRDNTLIDINQSKTTVDPSNQEDLNSDKINQEDLNSDSTDGKSLNLTPKNSVLAGDESSKLNNSSKPTEPETLFMPEEVSNSDKASEEEEKDLKDTSRSSCAIT